MLVLPEQVIASAMHGGSLIGNVRRAGKAGLSQTRKRQAAAALALGIAFGVGGGQYQRHRAAQQSALQHKLDSLVLGGVYDWDSWAKQVAADLK